MYKKVVLEPRASPENTSKYVDTVTVFAKTWTKGHWPLDDLWPHICWGLMCDSRVYTTIYVREAASGKSLSQL